jgi:hypothetical protein
MHRESCRQNSVASRDFFEQTGASGALPLAPMPHLYCRPLLMSQDISNNMFTRSPFPESVCSMTSLLSLNVWHTNVEGTTKQPCFINCVLSIHIAKDICGPQSARWPLSSISTSRTIIFQVDTIMRNSDGCVLFTSCLQGTFLGAPLSSSAVWKLCGSVATILTPARCLKLSLASWRV